MIGASGGRILAVRRWGHRKRGGFRVEGGAG